MNKLDQVVYLVDGGVIRESTIRDLSGFIDETTTPYGIAPRFHVRKYPRYDIDGESFRERSDAEDYSEYNGLPKSAIEDGVSYELWSWGVGGNYPSRIDRFNSEEEAQVALEETFLHDFSNADIVWFHTRQEAEDYTKYGDSGRSLRA